MVPPVLVRRVRGAGMAEMPLGVRFFSPVVGVENEGKRVSRASLILARTDIRNARSWSSSSSMLDMPFTAPFCPEGLLSEDRGRRLSVVGFVE